MTPRAERELNLNIKEARSYGADTATREFAAMLNPEYRGPIWDWRKLENFAAFVAGTTVLRGFPVRVIGLWGGQIKAAAEDAARLKARELLEISGVLELWAHEPTPRGEV